MIDIPMSKYKWFQSRVGHGQRPELQGKEGAQCSGLQHWGHRADQPLQGSRHACGNDQSPASENEK